MTARPRKWWHGHHARGSATLTRLAAAAALMLAAGCEIPAYVLSVMPEKKAPAVFEPPDQLTVVLVDDPADRLPSIQLMGLIADRIARDLREQRVIGDFVEPKRVDELRLNEPEFRRWPVTEIGRRLGARQVIHVSISSFALAETTQVFRPTAAAYIKVIDVAEDRRLFPEPDRRTQVGGYPVSTMMFYRDVEEDSRGESALLARQLAQLLAQDAARLFYDHAPRKEGAAD